MIKVFSLNKTLFFIDQINNYAQKTNNILISVDSEKSLKNSYDTLIGKNNLSEIYFYNGDIKWLFDEFKKMFRIIEAAGGVVKNENEKYLFILRHNKWDLPKGKIEKIETTETAAIREVEEECGIDNLKIIKQLQTTYHIYSLEEQAILKPTYWFLMQTNSDKNLTPQLEEGITEVKWFKKNELNTVQENTYESIKEVLKEI